MNTYKDDPSKGLSKFQKSILLRIDVLIDRRLELSPDLDYMIWATFPREEMNRIYWGMVNLPMDTSWRVKYHRVKKSLLKRGLIEMASPTRSVRLTDLGKELVDKLKSDNNSC